MNEENARGREEYKKNGKRPKQEATTRISTWPRK